MRLVVLALLLLPLGALADEKSNILTVRGEAVSKVAPDQVTLPVTVREENVNAKVAKERQDEKLRGLLKLAESTGIDKNDIQTSYTSVNPLYDYPRNEKPKLRSYQVETSINFTLNDISKLGDFMNGVIELGITDMGSVSYSVKDEEKIKEQTLAKALEKAYEKATLMASVAKVSIDRPIIISEEEAQVNYPPRPRPLRFMAAMAAGATEPMQAAPDLPSGLMEVRQAVTVTYQIK